MSIVTVWSYAEDGGLSGISPADPSHYVRDLDRRGHAITTVGSRPSNHHVIGVGMGHDDAEFAEAGRSMAAYYENGEAYRGRWWEDDHPVFGIGPKHYGTEVAQRCEWCDKADRTVYRAADGDDAVCSTCRAEELDSPSFYARKALH